MKKGAKKGKIVELTMGTPAYETDAEIYYVTDPDRQNTFVLRASTDDDEEVCYLEITESDLESLIIAFKLARESK